MQPKPNVVIDKKVFNRSVLALVVPMALQNLINVGVQSADVIMLGAVGEVALSASSLAGQVQFVMTLFFFGLASGAAVMAAQYWGKGDIRTIEKVMVITLRFSMLVAVVFAAGAFFFPEPIMRIFSPDEQVIAGGVTYLRWVAVSYLCMGFTNTYLNVLRSVEKVLVSTAVYFVSFLSNVVLNAVFIFGLLGAPAMGIAGAALATAMARIIELIIVIIYAARNKLIRLRVKDFLAPHKTLTGDFFRISGPTTLNELFWGLAVSANAVVIGHLGAAAVAANAVAQVTRQLAMVICFGLSNAAAIMVGKAIGGGEKDKAAAYAGRFVRLTIMMGLAGAALILLIRPLILWGMAPTMSAEAQKYLSFVLLLLSAFVIAQSYNTTMVVGIFRGGGDIRFGLVMDFTVMWGFSIPFGALAAFVFHWPVEVVYLILMSDEFIKLALTTLRYRSRSWLRDVTR